MTRKFLQIGEWLVILFALVIPLSTAATNIVVGGIIGCWFLSGHLKEKIALGLAHTLVRGFLVFFALYCIGLMYTIAPMEDIVHGLRNVARWWLLFFLLPFCQDKKIRKMALMAFVGAMSVTCFLGFFGFSFKNHIVTSYLMSFAVYLLLERAYYHKPYRMLCIIGIVAMVFNILFLSAGRTGYVLLLVLSGLFVWQHWRGRGLCFMGPVVGAILGLALQFSPVFLERFAHIPGEISSYQKGSETSMGLRLEFAKTSFFVALEHPFFGSGTGSFSTAYAQEAKQRGLEPRKNPHNEYLHIWIELGFVGVILLLLLFHRMWQCSLLLSPKEKMIAQGFILSFMIGCFGNSILMDFTERHFFVLMVALLFAEVSSPCPKRVVAPKNIKETLCHSLH